MFTFVDCALTISFNTDIFGLKQVQEYLLQTNSLPVSTAGLGILQISQELPLNHATRRSSIADEVEAILGKRHFTLPLMPPP